MTLVYTLAFSLIIFHEEGLLTLYNGEENMRE